MSIVLLSGGVDSAVLLAQSLAQGKFCRCLSFDYAQRHAFRELEAARAIAEHYRVERQTVPLPTAFLYGSALTSKQPVPLGKHYADPAQAVTVVPNRNMVLLSLAAALAVQWGETELLFAAHAGDAAIYPDCRPEFVVHLDAALRAGCGVTLKAPFLGMSKTDIVRLGRQFNVPLHLCWSCYLGGEHPCGQCGTCLERREAEAAS